jgi:hypothetical protein
MRPALFVWIVALAALSVACAGVKSRIKKNQAEYDSYPPAVRETIRKGRVEPGFTKKQVEIALGKPHRAYTRKTAEAEHEVWDYGYPRARPSVGLGIGLGMSSGLYGGGVGFGTADGVDAFGRDGLIRVVFAGDAVIAVEGQEPAR